MVIVLTCRKRCERCEHTCAPGAVVCCPGGISRHEPKSMAWRDAQAHLYSCT